MILASQGKSINEISIILKYKLTALRDRLYHSIFKKLRVRGLGLASKNGNYYLPSLYRTP